MIPQTVIWFFIVYCAQGLNPKATECSDTMRAFTEASACEVGYKEALAEQAARNVAWTGGIRCRPVTVEGPTTNLANLPIRPSGGNILGNPYWYFMGCENARHLEGDQLPDRCVKALRGN